MKGIRALVARTLAAGLVAALAVTLIPGSRAAAQGHGAEDPVAQAKSAIDRGLRWLRSAQQKDGSYGGHLGVTALVVTAMAKSHREYREEDGPFMRDAIAYIRQAARPDGSITHGGGYEMYTTALSIIALKSLEDPRNDAIVQKAQAWMKAQQTVEHNGYRPEDKFYGGFGYGSSLRPDLSNTQYAIEALRLAGLTASDPVFVKALKFVERIQNRTESNDQPGAGDDGGFAYYPGYSFSPSGGWTSTGSMSYAGIKAFLFMDIDKNDPRVQAAVKWALQNYTLDENPDMGANGYYYYVDVFAKTWATMGLQTVVTPDGVSHDWFRELVAKLVAAQTPEGYWVNTRSGRFWEDRPELATAHAVLALEYGVAARAATK